MYTFFYKKCTHNAKCVAFTILVIPDVLAIFWNRLEGFPRTVQGVPGLQGQGNSAVDLGDTDEYFKLDFIVNARRGNLTRRA